MHTGKPPCVYPCMWGKQTVQISVSNIHWGFRLAFWGLVAPLRAQAATLSTRAGTLKLSFRKKDSARDGQGTAWMAGVVNIGSNIKNIISIVWWNAIPKKYFPIEWFILGNYPLAIQLANGSDYISPLVETENLPKLFTSSVVVQPNGFN